VPELVQPPADPTPAPTEPAGEKPTPAEQVYTYAPGITFAVRVPTNTPLDLLMERGEQVRNIVGGDRAPTDSTQTARWEGKEGAGGRGVGGEGRGRWGGGGDAPPCLSHGGERGSHHGPDHHDHETHLLPDV